MASQRCVVAVRRGIHTYGGQRERHRTSQASPPPAFPSKPPHAIRVPMLWEVPLQQRGQVQVLLRSLWVRLGRLTAHGALQDKRAQGMR